MSKALAVVKPKKDKALVPVILTAPLRLDEIVNEVSAKLKMMPVNISRGNLIADAMSTGCLTMDLLVGGGFPPGTWVTVRGKTGSGKSTFLYYTLRKAVEWGVPVFFLDYEGSTSPDLLTRIIGMPLEKIMGVKDNKGNWVVSPLMRYIQPTLAEDGFRFMHRIMKQVPDKIERDGKWYLVYDKEWKDDIEGTKDRAGYKHFKENGRFFVETDEGGAQAIFFIDSLAAMFPESRDEDDEASPMAKMARMFSENIPMVKTKLAGKRVSIVAANQIRTNPMARFVNPDYEPGGQALAFYPDVIIDLTAIAVSTAGEKGKGNVFEEPCADGESFDRYHYTKIFITKNKKFSPYRKSKFRIWFEHKGQSKGGIDPFYDVLNFMKETGQVEGNKSLTIKVPGIWTQRKWTYLELKELILLPSLELYKKHGFKDPDIKALRIKLKELQDPNQQAKVQKHIENLALAKLDLREACNAQIQDSTAFKMYFDTLSTRALAKAEEESKSKDFGE
jgi:RecA/RadA recombinase